MPVKFFSKKAAETSVLRVDFGPSLEAGQAVVGASVTAAAVSLPGETSVSILGTPTTVGNIVSVPVTTSTKGKYRVFVTAQVGGGETLVEQVTVLVE